MEMEYLQPRPAHHYHLKLILHVEHWLELPREYVQELKHFGASEKHVKNHQIGLDKSSVCRAAIAHDTDQDSPG